VGFGAVSPAVRALGPVEVIAAGQVLRATPLQRTLVAVLAAHRGQVVSIDRLVDALWADTAPSLARNRVQSIVSSLRKLTATAPSLGGLIVTSPVGYALHLDHTQLDIAGFEHSVDDGRRRATARDFAAAARSLREALTFWRGDPFQGVDSPYVTAEAARLQELRHVATEEMVEASLTFGDYGDLVAELTGLVAAAPYRVRLRGQLMRALYRLGRQAEALEVYRRGAQILSEDHGLDPGGELQRLRDAILLDDPALSTPKSPVFVPDASVEPVHASPGRSGSTATPCLLPSDIADFADRAAQLAAVTGLVLDQADPASVPVVAVTGRAGVGKTALAVRAAHRLSSAFPDGQLFIDMGGAGPRPVTPEAALSRFLRALGVEGKAIPADVDERAELYRGQLAERRVLIVVDNAGSAAQVRPLLPGRPGCAVLVTSRRPLTGLPGAGQVELDTLSPRQAVELLAHMVGAARVAAEPEAAYALVDLCGGLPLAIRIAGGRLASRPTRPLGWLTDRLADRRRRLDELALDDLEVRASLAVSYRGLSTVARSLFRTVGLLESPGFAPWLAAAMLDTRVDTTVNVLESLVDERLVDVVDAGAAGPRYRLHDLVRLYARERAEEEDSEQDRRAALARAAGACLYLTELAVDELPIGHLDLVHGAAPRHLATAVEVAAIRADPVCWLDAEWLVLADAVVQAAAVGLAAHAWDLAGTLQVYLRQRHLIDPLRQTHEVALQAARLAGDHRGEGALLRNVALLHGSMNRVPEGIACSAQSADVFMALGDRPEAAASQLMQAMLLGVTGRVRDADRLIRRALPVIHTSGLVRAEAYGLTTYASLLFRQHRLQRAERCLRRALPLARETGFRECEGHILAWLGRLHLRRGDVAQAVDSLENAVATLREIDLGPGTVNLLPLLAEAYAAQDDRPTAERYLSECLQRCHEYGDVRAESTALRVRGQLRLAHDDADGAVADLTSAVHLARQFDVPWDLVQALSSLAEGQRSTGDTAAAETSSREAADLRRSLGIGSR
jgi:DNA-binding SARP family transcriptional activator/tetratricopeptide (TPR) repeat protein